MTEGDYYQKIIEREIQALQDKESWLQEFTALTTETSKELIERVYRQLEAENRRVEEALKVAPYPEPKASLRDILLGIAASLSALTLITLYSMAKEPPRCAPHVNTGTLDNPIEDRNWRVETCEDSRDTLSKLFKPVVGIFR